MRLEMKDISVIRSGKSILANVSLNIQKEQTYAVVGPSGSGKTTLLRLFNRMTLPTRGALRYRGKDASEYPVLTYRRRIPIVFQEPVLHEGTVRSNLLLPFTLKKWEKATPSREKLEDTLEICQIKPSLLAEDSRTLSGGEKQRMAMARALLLDPEVLLLDEPTSALDPPTAMRVIDAILTRFKNLTIICVTHARELIHRFDKKIILQGGRITHCCESLTPEELQSLVEDAE